MSSVLEDVLNPHCKPPSITLKAIRDDLCNKERIRGILGNNLMITQLMIVKKYQLVQCKQAIIE